jgi:hypothetical protein
LEKNKEKENRTGPVGESQNWKSTGTMANARDYSSSFFPIMDISVLSVSLSLSIDDVMADLAPK